MSARRSLDRLIAGPEEDRRRLLALIDQRQQKASFEEHRQRRLRVILTVLATRLRTGERAEIIRAELAKARIALKAQPVNLGEMTLTMDKR